MTENWTPALTGATTCPMPPPLPTENQVVPPPLEKAAIWSFVFGVLGLACCGISSVLALGFGHVARRRIAAQPGRKGRALAMMGLALGYLQILALIAGSVVWSTPSLKLRSRYALRDATGRRPPPSISADIQGALFVLITPKGYDPTKPVPCVFWLHGLGSDGSDVFRGDGEWFQGIADRHQIAFVGITAGRILTAGEDKDGRVWAESAAEDQAHLETVLKQHATEVTPDWGRCLVFGFSQGAKMAGLLLAHHPDKYRGALLFSPGGMSRDFAIVPPGARLEGRKALCVWMEESFVTKSLTRYYAAELKAAGALVTEKYYPDVRAHQLPPDFSDRFEGWLSDIAKAAP